ncbi:transporter [Sphingobium sp. BYY-5]|uniref:transporter n=1 Tax=Sphingobium sp. BYY-5 TaxID=2926400 RepID=UPI001FA76E79|nr:transporter [Sphingobium sp. BYY-5]MCI4591503.1 transporter [Sphingobium sp. BYY-5]
MKARIAMVLAGLFLAPASAHAQEERALCADRPGLGTPPCTVEPGRIVMELGLGDWTRESDAQSRTDTMEAGELLMRVGLTDSLEAQLGWTAYGHVRSRDRISGLIDRSDGVGDVRVALLQNLRSPDGSGFSIAVMPYATAPVGGAAIGAGDWGAGLLVPISFDLGAGLSLGLTPEADVAIDEDGDGRHLAFGSVIGLGMALGETLSATVETSLMRDDDPDGHSTQALGGLSLAWQPSDAIQFDIGLNIGLNEDSPDSEVYLGIARRF